MKRDSTDTSRSYMRMRVLGIVICFTALTLRSEAVGAQAERLGIRVRYTSIAANGGLEGRAFLPVSPAGVARANATNPRCRTTPMLTIKAHLGRGALRSIELTFPEKVGQKAEIAATDCMSANVTTGLEDGTVLRDGKGYVALESLDSQAHVLRGRFAQTALRDGTPVTVEGTFAVTAPTNAAD